MNEPQTAAQVGEMQRDARMAYLGEINQLRAELAKAKAESAKWEQGCIANANDAAYAHHVADIDRLDLLNARTELDDNERWMREVLTDFRIPFDDHKIGRRLAFTQWMAERNSGFVSKEEFDALSKTVTALCLAIDPESRRGPETEKIVAHESAIREKLFGLLCSLYDDAISQDDKMTRAWVMPLVELLSWKDRIHKCLWPSRIQNPIGKDGI